MGWLEEKWDEWFGSLKDWLVDAFKDIWAWIVGAVEGLLEGLISSLVELLPDVGIDVAVLKPYVNVVNAWVPLDLFITLLTAYMPIMLAVLTYRTIKKHIPTES